MEFKLWLETELGDPGAPANQPQKNFCNVQVSLADGREYALSVWTFDFLPLARLPCPYEENADAKPAEFLLPPDLFVESLTRETMQRVFADLIARDEMRAEWLNVDDDDDDGEVADD